MRATKNSATLKDFETSIKMRDHAVINWKRGRKRFLCCEGEPGDLFEAINRNQTIADMVGNSRICAIRCRVSLTGARIIELDITNE